MTDWEEVTKTLYDSRDLRLADSRWLEIFPKLKEEFGLETQMQLEISCVWRSLKAQQNLYAWGRTKGISGVFQTRCDGVTKVSTHQGCPSRAVDVYVCISKKAIWQAEYYTLLGPLAKKYDLIWGGDWDSDPNTPNKFNDLCHLELKKLELPRADPHGFGQFTF